MWFFGRKNWMEMRQIKDRKFKNWKKFVLIVQKLF